MHAVLPELHAECQMFTALPPVQSLGLRTSLPVQGTVSLKSSLWYLLFLSFVLIAKKGLGLLQSLVLFASHLA